MSDYTPTTTFATKDALPSGDPNKVIMGADVDVEFGGIQTAVASKLDTSGLAAGLPPNTTFFRANRATKFEVADGTWTTVPYNTEVTDEGGYYATTGIFTAPATGYYLFTAAATWDSDAALVAGTQVAMRINAPGGTLETFRIKTPTAADLLTMYAAYVIKLSATNTVQIQVNQSSGAAVDLTDSATRNWFTGARIA